MKKVRIGAGVLIYGFLAIGAILCALDAFLMAYNNAMIDYYEQTRRQFAGWMLCLVPAVLVLGTGVLYYLRKKSSMLWLIGIEVARLMMILPIIYMIYYREFLTYAFWGVVSIFIATTASYVFWLFKNTNFVKNLFGWHENAPQTDEVFA